MTVTCRQIRWGQPRLLQRGPLALTSVLYGLLTPDALDRLLTDAMKRQQTADALLSIADRVAEAGIAAMPMDEIDAEVKAAQAERRRRASGS
jgi:hypothetical protein